MTLDTRSAEATLEFIRRLYPVESLETKQPGKLVIACTGDDPTDYVEDGKIMGIHGDVRRRVAELLGLEPVPVSMPFADMVEAVRAGRIDIPGIGTVWTPERANHPVTQPFQYFYFGVASLDLDPVVDVERVAARNVVALDGSFNNDELELATRAHGGSLVLHRTLEEVLEELRSGRCDVAVYDHPNIERAVAADPALAGYRISRIRFDPAYPLNTGRMPLRLLFAQDAPNLCAAAMLVLDLLRASGELARIYESYGCSAAELLDMSPTI